MHHTIIIEGLMGAGKSTLATELGLVIGDTDSKNLVLLEPDEEKNANPYLSQFYGDMARWAFPMQVHMLAKRYRHALQAQWHVMNDVGHAVCDKSLYGDTCFARLMFREGHITSVEMETYRLIYENFDANIKLPSVCVRLRMDPAVAHRRIKSRAQAREGRRFESEVSLDYLYALDHEIDVTVEALRERGVRILDIFWGEERASKEAREGVVRRLAEDILDLPSKRALP